MKKKLNQWHKEEFISYQDFKNYYRPLKRSVKVKTYMEDKILRFNVEMDVKEVFSNKITNFCYDTSFRCVEPYDYTFDMMYSELLDRHLKLVFFDIIENHKKDLATQS